jgi:hypothetical protein
VRAVVNSWEPSWCTWTSHRLRIAQGVKPGEVVVGWATYLAKASRLHADRLPECAVTSAVGNGVLITIGDDSAAVPEPLVLAVRQALFDTGTAVSR